MLCPKCFVRLCHGWCDYCRCIVLQCIWSLVWYVWNVYLVLLRLQKCTDKKIAIIIPNGARLSFVVVPNFFCFVCSVIHLYSPQCCMHQRSECINPTRSISINQKHNIDITLDIIAYHILILPFSANSQITDTYFYFYCIFSNTTASRGVKMNVWTLGLSSLIAILATISLRAFWWGKWYTPCNNCWPIASVIFLQLNAVSFHSRLANLMRIHVCLNLPRIEHIYFVEWIVILGIDS